MSKRRPTPLQREAVRRAAGQPSRAAKIKLPDISPSYDAGAVQIAYVHPNEVAHSWHLSMLNLMTWDLMHDQHVVRGGFLAMRYGSGGIVAARNEVAQQFHADKAGAEWLFWVDTDMGFAPNTVDRLLAAADPVAAPIVGALCFAQHEHSADGLGGYRVTPIPTLYRWVNVGDGVSGLQSWSDYPREEVVKVDGTGSACVLIHRTVFDRIFDNGELPYARLLNPGTGQLLSEDLSFCVRAGMLGMPVHIDTSVKTSHLKPQWVTEAVYDAASDALPKAG